MLDVNNYPKAYAEALEILRQLSEEDYSKIDKEFINMLEKRKDKNYSFKLDKTKEIEEQNFLKETSSVLAYVFLHYLANQEEKVIITKKLKNDIIKNEQQKKEKYSSLLSKKRDEK